jgi:magnesium chelatase family protein
MNPCRCGYYPDKNRCTCSEKEISNYRNKLSGPLLDRIDMYVETARVDLDKLQSIGKGESSESIRKKVEKARKIQEKRFQNREYSFNAEIPSSDIETFCSLGKEEKQLMELAYRNWQLSARTYHRVLKVARTIADLEGCERIKKHHIAEALAYRLTERNDRKDG